MGFFLKKGRVQAIAFRNFGSKVAFGVLTFLASFPLANGIAEISQELVLLGPSGSLTHDCTSVTLRCSWPGKKEGDSRSQIRAVESKENQREKSTVEIHHQTGFQPEGKAKHQ